MTPEHAALLRDAYTSHLRHETGTTLRVLAAIPEEGLDAKPHEKAMSLRQLGHHVVEADRLLFGAICRGTFAGAFDDARPEPATAEALVAAYRDDVLPLVDAFAALAPERLRADVEFFGATAPLVEHVPFALHHSIHHRGQLSTYLRWLGARVPSIYGPTADEPKAT